MEARNDVRRLLTVLLAGMAACACSVSQAQDAYFRFDQFRLAAQYAEAEKIAIGQKAYFEQNAPHEITTIARWSRNLGNLYLEQGRYDEAEPLFKQALALAEEHAKIWPPEIYDLTAYQVDFADLYLERSRYDLAEPLVMAALKYRQKGQLVDPEVQVQSLLRAARILRSQGMEDLAREAEKYATNRPQDEKARREINTAAVAESLDQYGRLLMETGKYSEAEKAFEKSLELREDLWGPLQRDVAWSMDQLGQLYLVVGQYTKAEARLAKAVSIREQVLGQDKTETAAALVNLGAFYTRMGRVAEADNILLKALDIYAQRSWLGHPDAAQAQFVLGSLYAQRGRFAEADQLHRRALAVRQKVFAAHHKSLAQSFDALARLLVAHGRGDEARRLAAESLAIREKIYGREHIEVAAACLRLAEVEQGSLNFDKAAEYLTRAADIRRKALDERHPDVAQALAALGRLRVQQDQRGDARKFINEALAIHREKLGAAHEETLIGLLDLAELDLADGRHDEAKKGLAQADDAAKTGVPSPQTASRLEALRAELSWNDGAKDDALMHLERAIDKAEQQRAFAAGAEQEQGALFAQFAGLYHRLVAWHLSLGHTAEAFAALERARARSLLDQMALQGADPLAGLDPQERETLGRRHTQAQMRLAGLTRQLSLLAAAPVKSLDERDQERDRLIEAIRAAQEQVLNAYRELRAASRTFQLAGQEGTPVAALADLQQFVQQRKAAYLSFLITGDACYRLVLTKDRAPQLEPLSLTAELAAKLGMEPADKVTADQLWALFRVEGKELSQWLADAKGLEKAQDRLAVLWEVLVPPALREGLSSDVYDLLIVAPDGPLARLPLETLVLEPGADPKFLLDVGPPTIYVPSATVLLQLALRAPVRSPLEPVFSVGDPLYQSSGAGAARGAALVSPQPRFAAMAGGLGRLPFTAWETKWVVDTFARSGTPSVSLTQADATERACREKMPGREIIHMACHGLCDEASGNLFGALAVSANPTSAIDPADDGFLTLTEIYGLNLAGNELAILSACQTNAGPLTRGEGVWALSRGFLVAGSRRVVASNWLVDDEAGASLVSYFSTHLAQGRSAGHSNYAAALLAAKRGIRQQDKWRAPYYWAGLVLVGPN